MLKLLKRTIVSDDDDDETELASPLYEIIMDMMLGERLDIVEWMVSVKGVEPSTRRASAAELVAFGRLLR